MSRYSFNLEAKFVSLAAVLVTLLSAILTYGLYKIELKNELISAQRRALLISESTAASFTNTLLYEEIGLIEEGGLLENQITDLIKNAHAAILEMAVLDAEGKTIAASNYEWFQNDVNFNQFGITIVPDTTQIRSIKQDGIRQLEILSPLSIHGKVFGILGIYYSLEKEYEQFARWRIRLYVVAFLVIIASLITAFIVAKVLAKPIKQLAGEMVKVKDTSYIPSLVSKRIDEIGLLERGFLNMMERLRVADDEKQQSQLALLRTEKMATVGTFTAGLAHEINNPLGGMKTCLKRIKNKPEDHAQTIEYIKLMEKALSQIENLIQGLLNYSRAKDPFMRVLDLNTVIDSVTNFVEIQLDTKKVSITKSIEDKLPKIQGDSQHLEQVFLNLILNAIDAVEHDGKIEIAAKQFENVIIITVRDNGEGIPADELVQIFDPLFTTKPKGKGTGLGLSVCQNIMIAHGGEIKAVSEPGKGTIFQLKLPILDQTDPKSDDIQSAILAGGKSSRMGSNKALKNLNGRPIIEWVVRVLSVFHPSPMLITNKPDELEYLNLPMHQDIIENIGPLGGIYTALKNCTGESCLVVACDLPFLTQEIIKYLIKQKESHAVTVFDAGRGIEPLCAIYNTSLIPQIEERIKAKKFSLHGLIEQLDDDEVRIIKPNFRGSNKTFHNVNTPADLSRAQTLLKRIEY